MSRAWLRVAVERPGTGATAGDPIPARRHRGPRRRGVLLRPLVGLVIMCAAGDARAPPPLRALDLAGAVQTLAIDSARPPRIANGEPPWWPSPLPARPLGAPDFALTPGLPPYGAARAAIGYWSGWTGEDEAYPNGDAAAALPPRLAPLRFTRDGIELRAARMPPAIGATLPRPFAGRSVLAGAFSSYPYGQRYGYFEITAKVPHGDGLWPAFWLVPAARSTGEIDVTEVLGRDTTVSFSSVHSGDRAWRRVNRAPTVRYAAHEDLAAAFHRYGVDWGPDLITFYLDGAPVTRFPTPRDMHQAFFLIANLAVGTRRTWAGPLDATTSLPAVYRIAAIRVWQRPEYRP